MHSRRQLRPAISRLGAPQARKTVATSAEVHHSFDNRHVS